MAIMIIAAALVSSMAHADKYTVTIEIFSFEPKK